MRTEINCNQKRGQIGKLLKLEEDIDFILSNCVEVEVTFLKVKLGGMQAL